MEAEAPCQSGWPVLGRVGALLLSAGEEAAALPPAAVLGAGVRRVSEPRSLGASAHCGLLPRPPASPSRAGRRCHLTLLSAVELPSAHACWLRTALPGHSVGGREVAMALSGERRVRGCHVSRARACQTMELRRANSEEVAVWWDQEAWAGRGSWGGGRGWGTCAREP